MVTYFAVSSDYPEDNSNINVTEVEDDGSMDMLTEESYTAMFEGLLPNVEVTVVSFEETELDGYKAFRGEVSYSAEGISITQIQYIVAAGKIYTFTFTDAAAQGAEPKWLDAFNQCAETIVFI